MLGFQPLVPCQGRSWFLGERVRHHVLPTLSQTPPTEANFIQVSQFQKIHGQRGKSVELCPWFMTWCLSSSDRIILFYQNMIFWLNEVIRNKSFLFLGSIQYYQLLKVGFKVSKVPWNMVLIFLHWQNYLTVMKSSRKKNALFFLKPPHSIGNILAVPWSVHLHRIAPASWSLQLLEFVPSRSKCPSILTCIKIQATLLPEIQCLNSSLIIVNKIYVLKEFRRRKGMVVFYQ